MVWYLEAYIYSVLAGWLDSNGVSQNLTMQLALYRTMDLIHVQGVPNENKDLVLA
uniref:Uncharacterized protein n=1 Tax=Physcomitrium patens TaxID=3218 RepID=A0A2K1JRQ5_PHYPA|nr:hypothetical protein PHYPA_016597 [Physcomitrium patens]